MARKSVLNNIECGNSVSQTIFKNQIANLWTVCEVAAYLKVSIGHVYNLVSQDRIPYRKRGRLLRFLPDEIFAWLEGGAN